MENVIEISEKNFEKEVVVRSKKVPIVVDFWASWCHPCRVLSPLIEKVAQEYKGKFILAKLSVEENPKLAEKFDIRSIPTVKMFKKGKVVGEFIGTIPEAGLKAWIEKNL